MSAATLLVGVGLTQEAFPPVGTDSLPDFMQPAVVEHVDGELWATQRRWKSQFAPEGLHFTPTLGAGTPRSLPVSLELAQIERGSTSILDHGSADPTVEPTLRDRTVSYAHTADVLETYVVSERGLKQSFLFQHPLPGTGDLVVRLRVETDLTAPAGTYREELVLRDGEAPIVGIGQVIGVDALGRRQAGEMRWDGEHLELVLPAAFVAAARYPLELDPFIGSRATMDAGTGNDTEPDVAYDLTNDVYLVVWNHAVSSTDGDHYAQRVRQNGTPVGNRIAWDVGPLNVHSPRVANINVSDAFYVVEGEETTQSGATVRSVWGKAIRASDGVAGPFLEIVDAVYNPTNPANDIEGFEPDVCGERTLTRDECLVVWRQYGGAPGIYGVDITVPTSLASSIARSPRRYTGRPFGSLAKPTICNSFGDTFRAMVVWKDSTNGIQLVVVDRFGDVLAGPGGIGVADPTAARPAVDGDGTHFFVAFRRDEPGCTCKAIHGAGLEYVNGSVRGAGWNLDPSPGINADYPSVAMVRPSSDGPPIFGVTWSTYDNPGGAAHAVYATFVGTSQGQSCGGFDVVTEPSVDATFASPRMFSRYNGGAAVGEDQAMIAHMGWNGTWTSRARGWQAFGNGGPVVDRGGSCGQGGRLSVSGPFAVGNPDCSIELRGANNGLTSVTILDLAFGSNPGVFTCGSGCQLMLNTAVALGANVAGGDASIRLPPLCDSQLLGTSLSAQFVTSTPFSNPCGFATVSVSNWVTMTLGR